eukprot:3720278-Amphidinium_carterae.2
MEHQDDSTAAIETTTQKTTFAATHASAPSEATVTSSHHVSPSCLVCFPSDCISKTVRRTSLLVREMQK